MPNTTPRFPYDPHMRFAYDADTPCVETELVIRDPTTGVERGVVNDCLTSIAWFIAAYDLRPVEEKLYKKQPLVMPDEFRNHELAGTGGTAIDGLTSGQLLEGMRARSGPYALKLVVHGDPDLIDKLMP